MSASDKLERRAGDAWHHHLRRVNDVLRRPGMYGRDEMAERLLLEAMAAVDGSLEEWRTEVEKLRDRGAFAPTGVVGAYSHIMPTAASRDAVASVYGEIALAGYAIGGAYDLAVGESRFRPSRAQHGIPRHVAGFGSGLAHVHPTGGRRDRHGP